jgi:dTDP-4-dehydrorhamnose 3,5-epimerase
LCSEPYSPTTEHGINPLDTDLAIPFKSMLPGTDFEVSPKDLDAPSLAEALASGLLPTK